MLEVLASADASASLPRLGGMARPNGVAIVSERVWCFSRADGGAVALRSMPQAQSRLARLPFLRGLVKLGAALIPIFGRNAAARPRERLLLLAAIAAPLPLLAVPAGDRSVALVLVTAAMLVWMSAAVRSRCMAPSIAQSRRSRPACSSRAGAARLDRVGSPRAAARTLPR